jgi:hypothetical protein
MAKKSGLDLSRVSKKLSSVAQRLADLPAATREAIAQGGRTLSG